MPLPTLLTPGNLVHPAGHDEDRPIDVIMDRIKSQMPEYGGQAPKSVCDRLIVLKSKTGSGKSTTIPPELWRRFVSEDPNVREPPRFLAHRPGVVCTQPRLLTAIEITRGLPKIFPYLEVGKNLGFLTGGPTDPPSSTTHGALVYVTLGTLLQQLRTMDPADVAQRYRFIVLDEAHERSQDMDLALFLVSRLLNYMIQIRAASCPFVILMSATIDAPRYAKYFGCSDSSVFSVEGSAFPREEIWQPLKSQSYLEELPQVVKTLHEQNVADPPTLSDVLIFLPGKGEMLDAAKLLNQLNRRFITGFRPDEPLSRKNVPPFLVLTIESETVKFNLPDYAKMLAPLDELKIDEPDKPPIQPLRRVILATNVAETGLTLPTLKYVVDPGWARGQEFFPVEAIHGLITRPASQAAVRQRWGRAGRVGPGVAIRLYSEETFKRMQPATAPAIFTEPPTGFVLGLVCTGEFRLAALESQLLDPPPAQAVQFATAQLYRLGLIVPSSLASPSIRAKLNAEKHNPDMLPTEYGLLVNSLARLTPEQACAILSGYAWGASVADLATMHAFLVTKNPLKGFSAEARQALLEEGLPHLYKVLDEGKSQPDRAWMRLKFLLSDTALESLLLMRAFATHLAEDARAARSDTSHAGVRDNFPQTVEWCESIDVPFGYLQEMAIVREETLGTLVKAGLDPTYGQLKASPIGSQEGGFAPPQPLTEARTVDELLRRTVRLKQCMYEGFAINVGVYDESIGRYRLRGLPVKASLLAENEPKLLAQMDVTPPIPKRVLLYGGSLALSRKTGAYEAKAQGLSTLDGYVAS